MDTLKVPYIDTELVSYLKQAFPNKLPQPSEVDDIQYLIGQQMVISHLDAMLEFQKEDDPLAGV